MHKRGLKVALVAVLTLIFVLGAVGVAFAQWNDLSLSILGDYGVTEQQVANISDGFVDGSWQPYKAMPRKQFVKMAVDAYKIPLVSPAIPTYSDVPASDDYYEYVEAATAAGLTNGVGGGKMEPNTIITREQAVAIIARWVADKNGYNLETMYTDADAAAILGAFPDASAVGPSLQKEMAFAIDFGIVWGDASGKLAAKANLSRIQGAAMLIRSLDIIPLTEPEVPVVPVKIELVPATPDEAENLIGLTHQYTYKVTQADGSAAPGVLVDFDTLLAPWYVGNIQPAAAMSNANGEVTVNLVSTEVGIERVSAAAPGVAAIWSTKYWVALDEVYILDEDLTAENNAGETHTWEARVLVFGPGPLSTSQSDWYNLYLPAGDPSRPMVADGVDAEDDYNVDYSQYADELDWTDDGYLGRSLPGIPVFWQIQVDESVGTIVAAAEDGEIAADGLSAWAYTDADGLTSIDITSEETGETVVTAEANYEGNPYEWQLFDHLTNNDYEEHFYNWQDQPSPYASAVKTWIPHIIGGGDEGPITPAYAVNNTGEVELFTLALEDVFGNVIPGYTVEWWIQGVGEFKTDGSTWSGLGEQNKDVDITDANGEASVMVKSLVPGQTIVHVKVMDKFGLPYKEWNVVKQWYSIDNVMLGDADEDFDDEATNVVNASHTWTVEVSGAKYVYTIYDLNRNGLRDDAVLIGNRADMKAVAGVYANFDGTVGASKLAGVDPAVAIPFRPAGGDTWYIRFADMDLADSEFFVDRIGTVLRLPDGIDEVWSVLEGKGINFFTNIGGDATAPFTDGTPWTTVTSNTSLPTAVAAPAAVQRVGSITGFAPAWVNRTVGGTVYDYDAVTDVNGQATVTINSTVKGYQYVWAVADYPENPQNGNAALPLSWNELRRDVATKLWTPDTTTPSIRVFANAAAPFATGDVWVNPVLPFAGYSFTGAGLVDIAPPAAGTRATGTATLVGGAVTAITVVTPGTGYTAVDIGRTVLIASPPSAGSGAAATATVGVVGLTNNAITAISLTAGGTGYVVAPAVVIGAPQIAGGTQATATANVAGGNVVSVTITNNGSGYTSAPAIGFDTGVGVATATIATLAADGVATVLVTNGGSGFTVAPSVSFPFPLKEQATATATVVGGAITSVTVTNGGVGYVTAPLVTFGGGSGATATATVVGGVVTAVTVTNGGTGFGAGLQASGIADDANPNREVIAVQIFDQYGNALPDYFVTWEILGQGTTTPGTIATYHPYAHFMSDDADPADAIYDPAHNDPNLLTNPGIVAVTTAGTGDRHPFVDSNPIWDNGAAPYGDADDDWAWGWTLDGQINNTLDLASAAHITLVLDETAALLANRAHITNIVNIKVYTPTGVLIEDFEVTKEWSLEDPEIASKTLSISTTAAGPWVTTLSTSNSPIFYRIELLDQYGNPWISADPDLKMVVSGPSAVAPIDLGASTPSALGFVTGSFTPPIGGIWTLTPWNDTNDNGSITPGELTGNPAVLTFTGQPNGQ